MQSFRWFRGIVLLASLIVTAASCVGEPPGDDDPSSPGLSPDEIVHGRADRTRDNAVMALMLGDEGLCTATLIAPRAVLTARHCVSYLASESVDCSRSGRQVTGERAADSLVLLSGADASSGTPVARGTRVLVPGSDRLCNADVAVVVLDRDVTGVTPVRVDLTHAPRAGSTVSAVGFGRRSDRSGAGLRERRDGVAIVAVGAREFEVGQATCSGDSGGPALATGSGAIVGVVSRGSAACSASDATNVYTRVDAWASLIQQGIRLGGG